jgi:signal peptidase II
MQAARGASLTRDDTTTTSPPDHARRTRLLWVFALVATLGYAADLGSKELALARLEPANAVPVVGDWFGLYLTFNSGAAFSLGTSYTLVLTCIAIVAAVVVVWTARRLGSVGWALGLGFLLAGVLGNLTDRLFREPSPFRGHVVDFLQLPNFPVFNVADICINIAAAFIIIQALRGMRVDGHREGREQSPADGTAGGPER